MASLNEIADVFRSRLVARRRGSIRYAYLGDSTAVVTTHRQLLMLVDTRDRGITPHLAISGRWESYVERVLARLLRRGQRVVEVGANMGYHTLTMASIVGRAGHIDAFEPNPRLHELLTDSIALNGFQAIVTAHQSAALDRAGPAEFQFLPRYVGGGNVIVPGYEDATNQRFVVPGARLDDVLGDRPPVDLLRMDAEGSEPLVLKGAEELLRRSPRISIVTEFAPVMMAPRVDVPAFVGWLESLGFRAWRILPSGALAAVAMAALPSAQHCEIVLSRNAPPGAANR